LNVLYNVYLLDYIPFLGHSENWLRILKNIANISSSERHIRSEDILLQSLESKTKAGLNHPRLCPEFPNLIQLYANFTPKSTCNKAGVVALEGLHVIFLDCTVED
jgi:hypothetical protein